MIRSLARQRTTPWTAGIGLVHDPAEKGFVHVVELGRRARRRNVDETVRPLPLNRITQSRNVWRSIPPSFAASSRETPSRTAASARSLRACAPSFAHFAKPPNLTGRVVRPNRHRLAHGKHPSFANLNHVTGDSRQSHPIGGLVLV